MPLEDAAFGRHFVPDDGPAAEVLARKRAATYQRLTMQLTLEALLSGARRMTPLRAQALLEPEDSSSSDFVESPEESSPEVSDSDGGHPSSGPDDGRGAGDSEASPSLTVTSGASGELDTTGRSMPLEDAAFGRHFVPDDGPAAEVLARKRAATYQRLTMQLTLEALLSGARRMTPLRAQALLEPEDSSSSDFVESPEESSPEVSDSDGGNPSSGPDDGRGAGDSEASPSLTVTSGASGELDTTGVLAAGPSSPASSPASVGSMPLEDAAFGRHFVPDDGPAAEVLARKRAATYQRLTMQLTLEALLSGARRMTPLRAQALLEPEDSSSSDFVESPEESSPEVSDSDGGHPSSGPDDRRGAGEASPSLTVTSGASGELDTTGVLAAGPSSPASSPASVGSRRSLGIAAASPPSRAATTDSATADSEASEEDYLERYRVPVSSLPPSAAPGGPPGSAGSLSAAALSPSAAARFVAAADVSTDSGQSAASGYRV
ncbi:hypothetical protein GUITHDRAFT_121978 [Guillardia theta CCMP2712]|uniref:Uncharacterized protein n=1 Tax=Guillardia theta (strain CCMP2712) TaxID=905079 RepID=L1I6E3_GUITC|nr:hypothetical protein GUITHDRAFT_121978 [Guillardia theta CCMP2712]EKX31818.1 hypothetical protein GUITHDRAFT_121978 [Guillardia theta CCMP2712]|eukprot:XP_005818798.1 hypothetical protein GUITHDRAFT_121978 [Guillardia theta CCMP2712]